MSDRWSFPTPPYDSEDERRHRQQIAHSLALAMTGKLNCTGETTLVSNGTTTVVDDARMSPHSVVIFDPLTATAAAELASGSMYVAADARERGRFTIAHTNSASTDRKFRYTIIG